MEPPVITTGRGGAQFFFDHVCAEEQHLPMSLIYDIEIHELSNVTSVKLYTQPNTERAVLYSGPTTGAVDGRLVRKELTDAELRSITKRELFQEVQAGRTYIIVSTLAHPDGELRGTLECLCR